MENTLLIFIVFTVLNVIIGTVKSIATIRCGKLIASIINAIAYGLNSYIVVLTASDGISLWLKILIVAVSNFIGVFIVKLGEEKSRKDKLWKVEATFTREDFNHFQKIYQNTPITYTYIDANKYIIVNFYCETRYQSKLAKEILDECGARYFVSETKIL